MSRSTSEITRLLEECRAGDQSALEALFPLVYDELRAVAQRHLRRERRDHTLQATSLVHEAYLRLIDQDKQQWQNRSHFLSLAATAMRRILINHAHQSRAQKRGGNHQRVTLFEAVSVFEEQATDLLGLDEALDRLATFDPLKSRVVELRFFGGLTVEETARILELSTRTVERNWRLARAWLRKEVGAEGDSRGFAETRRHGSRVNGMYRSRTLAA